MLPVIRDHDGQIYFREWSGGLMSGGFEKEAIPVFHEGIPKGFEYQLLPENWDHFGGCTCWSEYILFCYSTNARDAHFITGSERQCYPLSIVL